MKLKNEGFIISDWVADLPFQQQAVLLTAVRGPDGCPKFCTAKDIIRFVRGAFLKPAWIATENSNSFMWRNYKDFTTYAKNFFCDTDVYPMHFLMHLFHTAEILGYKHPDSYIRDCWYVFYANACNSFHMHMETEAELDKRLNDFPKE